MWATGLTGAACDDALPTFPLGNASHKIVRAAYFEAENLLEVLALEIDVISEFCAEIRGKDEWSLLEDLVHFRGQDEAEVIWGVRGQKKVGREAWIRHGIRGA